MTWIANMPGEAWTAVGGVVVAFIGYLGIKRERAKGRIQKTRTEVAERELAFQAAALSFDEFLSEWNEIHREILALFAETHIDRFLILRAWNGVVTPRWTTAFFQIRTDGQQPINYVHFELDHDYVGRMNTIMQDGSMSFAVEQLPDSAIKDVYQAEGVTHSAWFFIDRKRLAGSESTAITYCSFATHEDKPISAADMTRMRIIASRMKGVAHTMNQASGPIHESHRA